MRWAALLGLLAVHVGASSTPLSIGLETGWPAPHPLHELLETVYADTPGYYLNWLTTLTSLGRPRVNEARSDKEARDVAFDLIDSYGPELDDLSKSIYKLSLGLHVNAPRLEAQYSWYESNVDEAKLGVAGCDSWVEWRGKGFCTHKELDDDVERSIEDGVHHDLTGIVELPFDRTSYPDDGPVQRKAILYYDPDSAHTEQLLVALQYYRSNLPSFGFVIRNKPPKGRRTLNKRTGVSGYGVELALKNTDYLVVDDRASAPATTQSAPSTTGSSHEYFHNTLGNDPWMETTGPLTKEELRELGLKAASLIMSSEDKLDALQHLSQDFPKYSAALSRHVQVSNPIRAKLPDLYNMGPMEPAVYINGKPFGSTELNAFSLLKALRDENDLISSLTRLGLSPKQAYELISDSVIGQAQTEEDPADGTVDASDQLEDGNAIIWWNDIEKDSRYKSWPKGIRGLMGQYLRPLYPGQLHTIRHNTWNLVFVLDLSSAPSLDVIASSITTMIQRGLPLRFGIVPMITEEDDDLSLLMAKVFFYSVKTLGRALTKDMFDQIVADTPSTPASPGVVRIDTVRKAYEAAASRSKKPALPFEEMLSQSDFDNRLDANSMYTSRIMAIKEDSPTGHLFINGKHVPMSGQWMAFVQQELTHQLQFLAEQIGHGGEPEDMSRAFYDLPTTTTRRSKYLLPGLTENKLKVFNIPKLMSSTYAQVASKDFVYTPDRTRGTPITIWIVGDLDSEAGRAIIDDALTHQQTPDSASRIGFLHLPTTGGDESSDIRFSTLLYTLLMESSLQTLHPAQLQTLLREFEKIKSNLDTDGNVLSEDAQATFEGTPLHAFSSAGWSAADAVAASKFWDYLAKELRPALGLRSTLPHLLINGRLVGPIKPGTFFVEDFDLFELYELRKRTKPVIDLLKTMYEDITKFDRATLADLISSASSVVAASYAPSEADGIFTPPPIGRNRYFERIDKEKAMSFSIGDPETALLHVTAVIDPISEQAQKWSSLLQTLRHLDHVAVSVYLQPQPVMSELTVKRFYRFALSHEAQYDVDGNEISPQVTFSDLPGTPILTLAMDTPPSWIVRPESSSHDLDNLVLGHDREPIHIAFNLNQLLIEGHAREANNAPPRGLQLQLTDASYNAISDTSVMANLGYFQFKATPGVYQLAIRPGRGREVYELESVGAQGWDSLGVNVTGTNVALMSFEGATILPRFERKKGMEMENVLMEAAPAQAPSVAGSVFTRMKQIVGLEPVAGPSTVKTRRADINIFTVASGLLYERFASIMILSVMKNTQSTVKFWFIENFLSPTFLEFVPKMAEEYGFEYEFVTYKWPHWLRAQTEKQRIIWAYKILFLDVLFPMDLDKVIFVDADQIVRVDMKELVDLDLRGHVYGYPPMGDDRTEMEGFRFWKTGYWKDALRGRPYHISALYVVDLKRFRQLATGDRLRGQYHALSADPNSLANLDQDLPNSMQDQIPIFTLDQDWLWCQTWCSDESLSTAKTIDLCQNPLTKEPKLKRARQIPEWDVYDREIADFAAKISGSQGALAASVDDLAGTKSAVEQVEDDIANEADEHARRIDDEL